MSTRGFDAAMPVEGKGVLAMPDGVSWPGAVLIVGLLVLVAVLITVLVLAPGVDRRGSRNPGRPLLTSEMLLVVVMLVLLALLVALVYLFPAPSTQDDPGGYEFRRQVISLLIAAFGAWIGAGAAYFFGRENLRVAADSILAMKEPSARERLRSKLVSELRPRQIPFTVTVDGHLRDVVGQVEGQGAWFITVLEADGRLKTVVNEDDLWRFSTKLQNTDQQSYEQVLDTTIADLVEFVTAPKDYRPSFVTVTPDRTAADANDEMTRAEARLAIVVDEQAKPLSFLTTGDIRRFLLSE